MELLVIGASHRSASVDVRGLLAGAAAALATRPPASVAELLVLSTCHRVEVVAAARDAVVGEGELRAALTGTASPINGLYVHSGLGAIRHLSRVAAGLDSLILGEAEVSGQIRRAVAAGRHAGTVGPILERVVAGVLGASGRARSETRISQGTLSASTAAVSLLERAWQSLDDRAVLVVGVGEAGRQALGRLQKRRVSRLLVSSRSAHHAADAARRYDAGIVDHGRLGTALTEVDGVIVATRASGYLIDSNVCGRVEQAQRLLEIVDLSMPRAVHPSVSDVTGVTLHTVDDLGDVVRESICRREREIPAVERIVADEAERTYQQFVLRQDLRRTAVA